VGSLSGSIERALGKHRPAAARELLGLPDDELGAAVAGEAGGVFVERAGERDPRQLRDAVRGAHAWACCRHDPGYPSALTDLGDAPAVLFGRGDPDRLPRLERGRTVTIVGARRPSGYGREVANALGRELAAAGMAVVSGMALGIDSCSHEGALEGAGLTAAVLGSGPDVPHPTRMSDLYERIAGAGLILTELPPGTTPRRWTFPARNRIMAALGSITIVVEARERSGSLITARIAEDLGREVGAVPGLVGSRPAAGTNDLIRDGAHLIRDGRDVLDSLLGPGAGPAPPTDAYRGPGLGPDPLAVLAAVEEGAATQDEVARGCGLGPPTVAAALSRLELCGLVACDGAGRYRRTALMLPENRGSEPVA
jgi:DNA processing protein